MQAATDELRRDFDRHDLWIENKDEVRKCLNIASDINVAMRNRKLGAATENNWRAVRSELNALAKVYGLPAVGGVFSVKEIRQARLYKCCACCFYVLQIKELTRKN